MDHAQGRAFHPHHLALAIMHLNHLAGLLPFFEPSIEWDDPMPTSQFRLERHTSRGLHTFVPLPSAPHPPTMVSHGGIPSSIWLVNPEPNLRPFTTSRFPHGEEDHIPGSDNTTRNPVPIEGHTDPRPPGTSTYRPGTTSSYYPDHNTGSCSVKTTCHLPNGRPTTEEKTEISVGSTIHRPPCVSSHHLRAPTWWLQLWWLGWWCSIQSRLSTRSHSQRPQSRYHHTTHHPYHHTTRNVNATGFDTKSHYPHPATYGIFSSSKWPTISTLVERRWSRADQP